jgi:hypothetical protein
MKRQEAVNGHDSATRKGAHANGTVRIPWAQLARHAGRVKESVAELPSNLEDQMKKEPYLALGLAAAAGLGIGIVLGSRILRTVIAGALTSGASYALIEFVRTYLDEKMPRSDGAAGTHS